MAKKIEIFENTLLKLLIRRGYDVDRANIVLTEGELGYTVDTKKLYVGDGQTLGGIPVGGSKFSTQYVVTTVSSAVVGDIVFDTSSNKLYTFNGGTSDPSLISNWTLIGGVFTAGNGSISINGVNNYLTVGTLSAGNFASSALGNSLELDTNNKIALSAAGIKTDRISTATNQYLNLPSALTINNVNYNWPSFTSGSRFLKSDIDGTLSWSDITQAAQVVVLSPENKLPVGSIMPFVSANNAPYGWLLCNGQSVLGTSYPDLSATIGTTYGSVGVGYFNVPNYVNKTLYGVSSSPSTSTTFSLASGTNSVLSAAGAFYIIKAISDILYSPTMLVSSPLSAVLNSTTVTGTSFNPLSGLVSLSLTPTLTATTTFVGSVVADSYGRVTGAPTNPVGETGYLGPGQMLIYNGTSPISFFRQPAEILAAASTTSDTSYSFQISAYPYLTDSTGAILGATDAQRYSVPSNAKNLIVETHLYQNLNTSSPNVFVFTTPSSAQLGNVTSNSANSYEYTIGSIVANGNGGGIRNSNQAFIPLSASNGNLVTAFRTNVYKYATINLRVVGYTV